MFQFDRVKVARYRLTCAARLKAPSVAYAAARDADEFLWTGHAKQRALLQFDLATVLLYDREPEEAFRAAAGALRLGKQSQSGRVVDAARQFRRRFTGSPAAAVVRSFDDYLYRAHL